MFIKNRHFFLNNPVFVLLFCYFQLDDGKDVINIGTYSNCMKENIVTGYEKRRLEKYCTIEYGTEYFLYVCLYAY